MDNPYPGLWHNSELWAPRDLPIESNFKNAASVDFPVYKGTPFAG